MNIRFYGEFCFEIITNISKDEKATIITTPFSLETGLKPIKFTADILALSQPKITKEISDSITGNYLLIENPGEYEKKGIFVEGIFNSEKNTIYTILAEDIKICHLGIFKNEKLSEEELERIGNVDILMVPVGGGETISSKEALKIIEEIEPKIIIPMHYSIPKLKKRIDSVDDFLKVMGVKNLEAKPRLIIKKKDIELEKPNVVVLKP